MARHNIAIKIAGLDMFNYAYKGFELISNTAQEVMDPERALSQAFFGSVIFVVILIAGVN